MRVNPPAISAARLANDAASRPLGAAEIGPGEDDAGAHDADADLAGTEDRQHEDVRTRAAGRPERVGGDDRGGVAGERRRVGCEVAQHRGDERADTAPQGQQRKKGDPILRKAGGQHHDRYSADHGADHPEPALAQRSPELRLAHDRSGGAGPKRVVELEPERDEQCETNGGPKSNAEEQRCASIRERVRQAPSKARRHRPRMHLSVLRNHRRMRRHHEAVQCCMCKFISSGGGIMFSLRSAMIQIEPAATRSTMRMPSASARTSAAPPMTMF